MKYNKLIKTFTALLTLAIGSTSIIYLQKRNLKQQEIVTDNTYYLLEEQKLASIAKLQKNMPSFGFDNLLADLTYLNYVQYFGDGKAREVTGYSVVTDYFEDIVNRDPNFIQSHLVMSSANSLFAAQPEKTVDLINQALENVNPQVPNYPFLLWTYKATDEILFLGDIKAAKNSYQNAAKWAKTYRGYENDLGKEMSERFNKTANFLASDPNPAQAQFGAWMSTLTTAKDRKTQDYVLKRLKELGAEINISPDGRLDIKPPKFNRA